MTFNCFSREHVSVDSSDDGYSTNQSLNRSHEKFCSRSTIYASFWLHLVSIFWNSSRTYLQNIAIMKSSGLQLNYCTQHDDTWSARTTFGISLPTSYSWNPIERVTMPNPFLTSCFPVEGIKTPVWWLNPTLCIRFQFLYSFCILKRCKMHHKRITTQCQHDFRHFLCSYFCTEKFYKYGHKVYLW